ncbi:hypothetical protein [Sphingomicrobium astaxanthinifaciens]|uniref:hypothetical protein n=1 Tax=Sphingomicrobium astaxanthinifaciens TaxID=1227949 RepID=UPI001FCC0211|nr:hypothetical protein [Sphingomicrobium astaxanthinifaciens]MCJ7422023.1 hypothetical protein [Sphingomicrobium astaxanthinifaciens]
MTEPHDDLTPLPAEPRHDGWTTLAQIAFLETLAATGIVTEACRIADRSSSAAYAFRRRNRLFAAAWEEALSVAREKLADTLLERSLGGQTEYYYRDGELVGEKKTYDSHLGLALLRRLDRKAEARAAAIAAGTARAGDYAPAFDRALDAVIAAGRGEVPQVDKVDDGPPALLDRPCPDRSDAPKL